MVRIAALALAAALLQPCLAAPPNPQIDYAAFARDVDAVGAIRESRRVSEDEFIRMAGEPGTVVLDARSERLFRLRHVEGARNLPFPEFTADTLAAAIPSRETRVLIYCNNNFRGLPESMPVKAIATALNLSTFVALHSYGYRNVYELGPAVDPAATRLAFAGDEVRAP
jgi:rhodanese-like protein